MARGHRRLRADRPSGLYRAGPPASARQQAVQSLRQRLLDDNLPGEPTAGQQIILSLIASAVQKHTSVADFPWSPGATGSHAAPGRSSTCAGSNGTLRSWWYCCAPRPWSADLPS